MPPITFAFCFNHGNLSIVIKKCNDIRGACIDQFENKIVLYADNVTLFLQQSIVDSLRAVK